MLQDIDAMQAHEARQERCITDIMESLHQATADCGPRSMDKFRHVAGCLLQELGGVWVEQAGVPRHAMYIWHVQSAVYAFTEDRAERMYLLSKVLEKITGLITAPHVNAWLGVQVGLPKLAETL